MQIGDFEILHNPELDFWSTFGQQIGKNTPPISLHFSWYPKKEKGI